MDISWVDMFKKRPSKNSFRSWITTLLASCLILCAAFLFPFAKDGLLHDYALYRYARAFRRLHHPANTTPISYKKYVGHITGNGNHCNYFVGELRRYTGDRQVIESFYSGQDYAGLGDGLLFIENGEFPATGRDLLPYGMDVLSSWLDSPGEPRDHLYLVYTFNLDLDPGWDIRCT
jgi:hypothetical protein